MTTATTAISTATTGNGYRAAALRRDYLAARDLANKLRDNNGTAEAILAVIDVMTKLNDQHRELTGKYIEKLTPAPGRTRPPTPWGRVLFPCAHPPGPPVSV
ncbi:hypothetical protein [Thermomonospora cellulosilytica]|uniref:Uncharacterized protein n=1 Tax=Thermomonospora cellulosilytica TaxID=1411118 RepID=A0A7W3N1S9_9ACTN|nr:hypothetical protein [Thermomonospora cellulosilytica]MBA9005960.1 hypothetical protein [Thermomonospora cellulosilytica]